MHASCFPCRSYYTITHSCRDCIFPQLLLQVNMTGVRTCFLQMRGPGLCPRSQSDSLFCSMEKEFAAELNHRARSFRTGLTTGNIFLNVPCQLVSKRFFLRIFSSVSSKKKSSFDSIDRLSDLKCNAGLGGFSR